jgi:coproporphyrinogen III oxidase
MSPEALADLARRAGEFFARLQEAICERLERLDGRARFGEDLWWHDGGGGGRTRVLSAGKVFEKAGVSLADVRGTLTERLAARLRVSPRRFHASGISVIVHPLSPMVPTVHLNLRLLALEEPPEGEDGGARRAWFGGGADLTPYYLFEEDAVHFHGVWRAVCDRHRHGDYSRFKHACDEYFRIEHRDEHRGVGGIFFDYLEEEPERTFAFVRDVGEQFLGAYAPIVERRMDLPWWDREREWQLRRRGRYVEFNLIYDRGTLFGLETRGRAESILVSLPPLVRWPYDSHPEPGSPEALLLEVLRRPRDWL